MVTYILKPFGHVKEVKSLAALRRASRPSVRPRFVHTNSRTQKSALLAHVFMQTELRALDAAEKSGPVETVASVPFVFTMTSLFDSSFQAQLDMIAMLDATIKRFEK